MKNYLLGLLILSFLSSCQSLKTRSETKSGGASSTTTTTTSSDANTSDEPPTEPSTQTPIEIVKPREAPRIGFIISAGGAKTMAAIGVLKEIQRLKIPVHAISGIEMGSFVAAVFAKNKLANEVEWQFSKFDPKAFQEIQNPEALNRLISAAWTNESLDSMKATFACPSLHIGRQQTYILAKGNARQVLAYCMPYPPLFKPYDQSVADLTGARALADYMRSRGANYVIVINVLASESKNPRALTSGFDQAENITWVEAAASNKGNTSGADFILNITTDSFGLLSFDKKKELMATGQDQAKKLIQHLHDKFGL